MIVLTVVAVWVLASLLVGALFAALFRGARLGELRTVGPARDVTIPAPRSSEESRVPVA